MARIMQIEDHEDIWDFLPRRLRRCGYDVILAHDGETGLLQARTGSRDVILLDMNLPALDGWTAARALKSAPATSCIPVIALTAHATSVDREKALRVGCDDYKAKPDDSTRLLVQIARSLPEGTAT